MAAKTSEELKAHLLEQVELLDMNIRSYDAGKHVAALQLAVTLRVLLHDTPKSHGLLKMLGLKDTMPYVAARNLPIPDEVRRQQEGLTPILVTDPGIVVLGIHEGVATWWPKFATEDVPSCTWTPFDEWWKSPVLTDSNGTQFTRQDFVLWLANKSGGAHVDRDLSQTFRALTAEGSMGFHYRSLEGVPVTASPIPAAMRQIAEELFVTMRLQIPYRLGEYGTAPMSVPPRPAPGSTLLGGVAIYGGSASGEPIDASKYRLVVDG